MWLPQGSEEADLWRSSLGISHIPQGRGSGVHGGENVQSDLLHKYQSKDDILILTVRLAVIVAVILTVPVLFFTVRSSLFEMARKTKFDLCRHVLVTLVLLVIINLLVIFIPSMKDIFGVVGVTSANMLIFILPSSLYLKITQQDGSKLTQRIWASLFLALGVLFSLVSIPLVIYDWVQSGGSAEGHWSSPSSQKKIPLFATHQNRNHPFCCVFHLLWVYSNQIQIMIIQYWKYCYGCIFSQKTDPFFQQAYHSDQQKVCVNCPWDAVEHRS